MLTRTALTALFLLGLLGMTTLAQNPNLPPPPIQRAGASPYGGMTQAPINTAGYFQVVRVQSGVERLVVGYNLDGSGPGSEKVLFDGSPRAGQTVPFSSGQGSLCIKVYGNNGMIEYQMYDNGPAPLIP